MSSDGCEEVAWKGNPFPYLLHKPRSDVDSYAKLRNAGQVSSSEEAAPAFSGRRAATGTWDGPAPRGGFTSTSASVQQSAGPQPKDVLLPSGYRMPLVGLGTYKIDSADTIRTALKVGYRHFDCASCYGNEATVGEGLKAFIAEGKRAELFVAGKLSYDANKQVEVKAACQQSMESLGCSYLDLYYLHLPEAGVADIEEDKAVTLVQTWEAMQQLVDEGLVRSIGVSNFNLTQVEEVLSVAKIKPCVNQVQLQPLLAQRKLIGVCFRKGVQSVAHSPLGHAAPELLTNETVCQIAKDIGRSPTQVVLKWNVQRGVPVIPKASSEGHLRENLELFDWVLSNQHKALLDGLDCGKLCV